MALTYMIIEDGQPMDGEAYDKLKLFAALPYADFDAEVVAFDFAELRADLTTPMRVVTEDMTVECWSRLHRTEREELAERGFFQLASRYISDEYEASTERAA